MTLVDNDEELFRELVGLSVTDVAGSNIDVIEADDTCFDFKALEIAVLETDAVAVASLKQAAAGLGRDAEEVCVS
jgi:hypothetical protein